MENFGFQMSIFFRKVFHDFPTWNFVEILYFKYLKFLIKSHIHTIKQHKNFTIF